MRGTINCNCGLGLSRRRFIQGATTASVFLPTAGWSQPESSGSKIIDTHHHYYSPGMKAAGGLGGPLTDNWSVPKSLDEMDRNGVSCAILSVPSSPASWYQLPSQKFYDLVREINDFGAQMVSQHPDRYGLFAFLSMVDVNDTLKEIEYVFDTLRADGVGIPTSYLNKYPGDPRFVPIFDELNRRKSIVYFHPNASACCQGLQPGVNESWIEVPQETSRAIISLLFSGNLRNWRDIKFLWSHGGGTLPVIADRVDWLSRSLKNRSELLPHGPLAELKKFYYDTANAGYPANIAALIKLVDASQIVFGTDYPYVTTQQNIAALTRSGLPSQSVEAIKSANAKVLIPRLGKI